MFDVALCTCDSLAGLPRDERFLRQALHALGLSTTVVSWTDARFDWSRARSCLPRSTWDYADRVGEFERWLTHVDASSLLFNPLEVQLWNLHKDYLTDLEQRGVRTLPSAHFSAGAQVDLQLELSRRGWGEFVIKPAVGATARKAMRLTGDSLERAQAHLDQVLTAEDAILQPFIPSVLEVGELSMVHVDGCFSHAVRKRAAAGEWRVQGEFGGTAARVEPRQDELQLARHVMAALPGESLYTRVDVLRDLHDRPAVIEVELIEPVLYFELEEGCAGSMARSIAARLDAPG